jgi:hypothetical protein
MKPHSDKRVASDEHTGTDKPTATDDRRVSRRRPSGARIRLSVEKNEIEGSVDNISETGVLFLTERELRVTVEIEESGTTRRRTGRLIRSQVMGPGKIGWAVEFDPA